jgi:tRNA threonylcarbamoyladenosine biosynthesis protein TsaE
LSHRQHSQFAADEEAMVAVGGQLAGALSARADSPLIIFLEGDLGMGKTTLSRGLIQALGHRGAVKSPTYTLVEPYEFGELTVYHFDLYRLGDPQELEFMGIHDYFNGGAVCLLEWPQRGAGILPPADIAINIERENKGRRLQLQALSQSGDKVLGKLEGLQNI